MSNAFAELFPELLEEAREFQASFSGVALVILYAGLILSAVRGTTGGDTASMLKAVASVGIITVAITFFPDWIDELNGAAHALLSELEADPSTSHQEFAKLILGEDSEEDIGLVDVLFSEEGGIGKAILYAGIFLVAKIAWLIVWLAYALQHAVLVFAIALSPGFLAMFSLEGTRGVAAKFVLSLIGVVLWPVGWAVADIVTEGLLRLAAEDGIYVITGPDSIASGTQTLPFLLLLAIWILVSTIMTPRLISKAIQEGSQLGVAMIGGWFGSIGQGVGYGTSAGVTAALAGGSSFAAGSAAIAAGTAGMVSGAMGSSGVLVPTAIGTMAVAATARSSREINEEAAEIARNNR